MREAIVQKERTALSILVGKEGAEEQKLQCLIKGDYPGVLAAFSGPKGRFNAEHGI